MKSIEPTGGGSVSTPAKAAGCTQTEPGTGEYLGCGAVLSMGRSAGPSRGASTTCSGHSETYQRLTSCHRRHRSMCLNPQPEGVTRRSLWEEVAKDSSIEIQLWSPK